MGFEPTRAEPIGLAVQRLNHSATQSLLKKVHLQNETIQYAVYLNSPIGILLNMYLSRNSWSRQHQQMLRCQCLPKHSRDHGFYSCMFYKQHCE